MVERHQPAIIPSRRRSVGLLATVIVSTVLLPPGPPHVLVARPVTATDPVERATVIEPMTTSAGPRLIDGDIAETLVLVRGGAVCSGTPITGTRYVATAAHCVLDRNGRPGRRTVVRDGETHPVAAVWVDTRYADDPIPRFDAAILELDRVLPGPSATIGPRIPTAGSVTIAGSQPVDGDGSLLRGDGPHDRPSPRPLDSRLIFIDSPPAGCTIPVEHIRVAADRVDVPCGLIPGASGGGLFVDTDGVTVLVGIISTVTDDLSFNGVVPAASLADLLRRPARYRYPTDAMTSAIGRAEVTHS